MTSMLGREGWIVDVAEAGAHALELTRQSRYDLVVTDLEMPELGGFELISRLRGDARFESTPIVVITSRASPEHRRRARDLGVRAPVATPPTRRSSSTSSCRSTAGPSGPCGVTCTCPRPLMPKKPAPQLAT
jgi:CheY-like chemotaxis protein